MTQKFDAEKIGGQEAEFSSSYTVEMKDSEFASFVSKELTRLQADAAVGESEDEDESYTRYLEDIRNNFSQLSVPTLAKKAKPERMVFGFSELSGRMVGFDRRRTNSADPESQEYSEKEFQTTQKLYLESARRMFPQVKAETAPIEIKNLLEAIAHLEKTGMTLAWDSYKTPSSMELMQMLEKDPKKLLDFLNDSVLPIAEKMQERAFPAFYGTGKETTNIIQGLANLVEPMYRAILLKNELERKMYGNENHTASEKGQIDALKEKIKG